MQRWGPSYCWWPRAQHFITVEKGRRSSTSFFVGGSPRPSVPVCQSHVLQLGRPPTEWEYQAIWSCYCTAKRRPLVITGPRKKTITSRCLDIASSTLYTRYKYSRARLFWRDNRARVYRLSRPSCLQWLLIFMAPLSFTSLFLGTAAAVDGVVPGKEIFGGSNCLLFRSSFRYNYGRQTDTAAAAADRRFLSRLSVSSDAPDTICWSSFRLCAAPACTPFYNCWTSGRRRYVGWVWSARAF